MCTIVKTSELSLSQVAQIIRLKLSELHDFQVAKGIVYSCGKIYVCSNITEDFEVSGKMAEFKEAVSKIANEPAVDQLHCKFARTYKENNELLFIPDRDSHQNGSARTAQQIIVHKNNVVFIEL